MGILSRLLRRGKPDPYWERFIDGPVFDASNHLTDAIRTAPGGAVFPIKSDIPEPQRMTQDLDELARFLGATALGVASLHAEDLRPGPVEAPDEEPAELAQTYPYVVIITIHTDHNPDNAQGVGGQFARQESASVSFSLAAYIRELGYQAKVHSVDSGKVAAEAGLGSLRGDGRLVTKEHRDRVFVGDGVLTDLPLALGRPSAK